MAPTWVSVAFGYLGGLVTFGLAILALNRYKTRSTGEHAGLEDMGTAYMASILGGLLAVSLVVMA